MISIGVSLDFISFSSKQYLSSDDCLSVTECLDFPCDLKEEEQVTCQKLCLSSISNIITSWQSNRSRSVGIRQSLRDPIGWAMCEGGCKNCGMRPHPSRTFCTLASLKFAGLAANTAAQYMRACSVAF